MATAPAPPLVSSSPTIVRLSRRLPPALAAFLQRRLAARGGVHVTVGLGADSSVSGCCASMERLPVLVLPLEDDDGRVLPAAIAIANECLPATCLAPYSSTHILTHTQQRGAGRRRIGSSSSGRR